MHWHKGFKCGTPRSVHVVLVSCCGINTPLHLAHSQARCSITYVFMKGYRELMEGRVPFHFEGLEFLTNCKAGFRCWHPVERTIRRSG